MELNLKQSKIYRAVSFSRFLILGPLKLWRTLFLIVGFITLGLYAAGYLLTKLDFTLVNDFWQGFSNPGLFLGSAYIFLPLGFSVLFLEIFFNHHLKYPRVKHDDKNLAEFLDFDSAMVLEIASMISISLKEVVISTNSLFLSLTDYTPANRIFIRLGINQVALKKQLEKSLNLNPAGISLFTANSPSEELIALINSANDLRLKHGGERITLTDLLASLFDYNQVFKKLTPISAEEVGNFGGWKISCANRPSVSAGLMAIPGI